MSCIKICECGCGQEYEATRSNQKYTPECAIQIKHGKDKLAYEKYYAKRKIKPSKPKTRGLSISGVINRQIDPKSEYYNLSYGQIQSLRWQEGMLTKKEVQSGRM